MGSTGSEPCMVKQKLKFPHHGTLHSSVGLDDMTDEACIAFDCGEDDDHGQRETEAAGL
jgi:hypothetical protein